MKNNPEVYYIKSNYYRTDDHDKWIANNQNDLRLYLRSLGLKGDAKDINNLSEIDRFIVKTQGDNTIDDIITLAGYNKGLLTINNKRVLVKSSPTYVIPKKGDYNLIDRLINDILGSEQQQHFYGWLHFALKNLTVQGYSSRGQAVFFVGPARSCKSLLQDLITTILGGRCAKPHQYLMGMTPFNAELFEAEHLKLEDEAGKDYDERGTFSVRLKGLIANTSHNRHEKGFTPNTYSPKWRITFSLNNDYESMKIIPAFDNGMQDKINIYKCNVPDMSDVLPNDVIQNEQKLMEVFKHQIPAFVYFLTHDYGIDPKNIDNRMGIKAYHNNELLSLVRISPMLRAFHETLQRAFMVNPRLAFTGKATDFMEFIKLCGYTLDSSFNGSRTFGRRMVECSEVPELDYMVKSLDKNNGSTTWRIGGPICPMVIEHNINEVAMTLTKRIMADNKFVNPSTFRVEFENWSKDQNLSITPDPKGSGFPQR